MRTRADSHAFFEKDGNVDQNEGEKERRIEIRQMVKYASLNVTME